MNMGMALSEYADKMERMDRAKAKECRDYNKKADEYCTLEQGHKGQHYGYMFVWENKA